MVVLHTAHFLGGDVLLGFVSAVAFATILAVVSGLTISAAATIAHDLYAKSIKQGRASEKSELLVSRCAVIAIGMLAILFGIAFEHHNVIFITNMALAVAGSANAPILLLSMYWRGSDDPGRHLRLPGRPGLFRQPDHPGTAGVGGRNRYGKTGISLCLPDHRVGSPGVRDCLVAVPRG